MQQNVYDMKENWIKSPQVIFNPKRAVNERIILQGRTDLKPDPVKPMHIPERCVPGYEIVIIPDETAADGWQIRDQQRGEQDKANDRGITPEGLSPTLALVGGFRGRC